MHLVLLSTQDWYKCNVTFYMQDWYKCSLCISMQDWYKCSVLDLDTSLYYIVSLCPNRIHMMYFWCEATYQNLHFGT